MDDFIWNSPTLGKVFIHSISYAYDHPFFSAHFRTESPEGAVCDLPEDECVEVTECILMALQRELNHLDATMWEGYD